MSHLSPENRALLEREWTNGDPLDWINETTLFEMRTETLDRLLSAAREEGRNVVREPPPEKEPTAVSGGWKAALNPYDYGVAFAEGVTARRKHADHVINPYLRIDGYQTGTEHTRALAWENGWWSARILEGAR